MESKVAEKNTAAGTGFNPSEQAVNEASEMHQETTNERIAGKESSEEFVWYPPKSVTDAAFVKDYDKLYNYSISHPEEFWEEQANHLSWYNIWDKVLDKSNPPFYKWFTGGKTNIILNAIDRHQNNANRNKLALMWEGEPGDTQTFSYHALNREVSQFANILKSMGVKKGDVVTIYMPQIPEQDICNACLCQDRRCPQRSLWRF